MIEEQKQKASALPGAEKERDQEMTDLSKLVNSGVRSALPLASENTNEGNAGVDKNPHINTEEEFKEEPLLVKGKVKSIIPDYGFIVSEDGLSHYFNSRVMVRPEEYADLTVGSPVVFEPRPSPKGMRAINVLAAESFFGWTVPDKFLTTHAGDEAFRPGEDWLMKVELRSRWFKDPSEGRSELVYLVEQAGGNRVSHLEMHRESINWGSFRSTRHSWSCIAGIYGKKHDHETEQALDQHNKVLTQYSESIERNLKKTRAMLDKKRFEQRRVGAGTYTIIGACLYFLAYIYLHH